MRNKPTLTILIIAVVVVGIFFIRGSEDRWICSDGEWVRHGVPSAPQPTELCGDAKSFEECVKEGNPVMESYPRQCISKAGDHFIENIGNELEKADLIRLNTPRPNMTIESPLVIEGEAKGFWFFEGDFPVILTDWDGLIIVEGFVTADGEWMTEEFVEFRGVIEFEKPIYSNKGNLILHKDNPSGLPENDDSLEIPILFK